MIIDYTKKPECREKIKISQYSDTVEPFKLKCILKEGHESEHLSRFWVSLDGLGETRDINWQ